MMTNPHNFPVDFEWELANPAFKVAPVKGTLQPHSAVEAVVTWQPSFGTISRSKGKDAPTATRSSSQGKEPPAQPTHSDAALQAQTTACMDLKLEGGIHLTCLHMLLKTRVHFYGLHIQSCIVFH